MKGIYIARCFRFYKLYKMMPRNFFKLKRKLKHVDFLLDSLCLKAYENNNGDFRFFKK